jgi:hypothetical protein
LGGGGGMSDTNYTLSTKAPNYRRTNCCALCRYYMEDKHRKPIWWCSKHADYFLNNLRPMFDICDDWEKED